MKKPTKIAVLGSGSGGLAFTAYLSHLGHDVCLWSLNEEKVDRLSARGSIAASGVVCNEVRVHSVTADIEFALDFGRIVLVTVPAHLHRLLSRLMAPHLRNDHMIVLNPGRTFGAIEMSRDIDEHGNKKSPLVVEAQTLLFTCRSKAEGEVEIITVKPSVGIAGLSSEQTQSAVLRLRQVGLAFEKAESIFDTSLNNMGAILHPAPVLFNIGRIESQGPPFKYYREGITETIAVYLEKMDRERLQIGEQIGCVLLSLKSWLEETYGAEAETLLEALRRNKAYATIDAPTSLNHRYILEDVPTGLVPLESLAGLFDLEVPHISTIVDLANSVLGIDFRKEGRKIDRVTFDSLL